jgi:hypothetical protein
MNTLVGEWLLRLGITRNELEKKRRERERDREKK